MEDKFDYSYSSDRQKELDELKKKYGAVSSNENTQDDKMNQLRKLDMKVENKSMIISLSVGIAFTLIMGFGMSLALAWGYMILGILVGLIGVAGMLSAYPVYKRVHKAEKEKLTPQILELLDELSE